MAHIAIFPDTSGKHASLYLLSEEGNNTRVYTNAGCIADKVPLDVAPMIAAAIRDAYEAAARNKPEVTTP